MLPTDMNDKIVTDSLYSADWYRCSYCDLVYCTRVITQDEHRAYACESIPYVNQLELFNKRRGEGYQWVLT